MIDPHYLLVSYDWHGGADGAILAPGTKVKVKAVGDQDVTQELYLSPAQQRLWNLTKRAIEETKRIIGPHALTIAQGGDICAGTDIPGEPLEKAAQIIGNQYTISTVYATSIIKALKPNVVNFYSAAGTARHSGEEGTAEQQVCIGVEYKTGVNSEALTHAVIDIGGCMVDFAHHGPPPGKNWTYGDPLRQYLKRSMMDEMDVLGYERPSDLYLRGHVHSYGHAIAEIERRGKVYESQIYIVPSMYIMNGYARKISRSVAYSRHGFVLIEIMNARPARCWRFIETYDLRQRRKSEGVVAHVRKNAGAYSANDGQME